MDVVNTTLPLGGDDAPGHLVLTRHAGERIMIGQNAEVVVTYLGRGFNGTARISIRTAKDVPVWREEIYHNIKIEEAEAEGAVDTKLQCKDE